MSRLDVRPSVSYRRYDRALDGRTLHRRHRRTMASSHAGGAEKDFDAGVSIASLPWGDANTTTVKIETMVQRDGNGKRKAFIARPVNRVLARGVVLVLHTAIGPWETFAMSCCEALASNGYDAVAPVTTTSAVRKPASSANAAPCIARHVLQWQYAGACDGVTDFTSIITPPHAHRPLSSDVSRDDDSGRIRSQRRLIKWLCAFAYAACANCPDRLAGL